MSLTEKLSLLVTLAKTLKEIHGNGIIHNRINPFSILINPLTREIRATDFTTAARASSEARTDISSDMQVSILSYISPEQTGRTNRSTDTRSDLYSMGAVFYRIITGRAPFESKDPLELIHCQVARLPLPPAQLCEIPLPLLSDIILKLLAKSAEDRYQTARGLEEDLGRCLYEVRSEGTVVSFALGTHDNSDIFHIPEKIFGRDPEIEELKKYYDAMMRGKSGRFPDRSDRHR